MIMEEMKLFVKTLMKCKSYSEQKKRLSESIDQLSFNYSAVYILLYREMKRREHESNNPYKICFWLNKPNCLVKLHEALILVKNNNFIAKEKYLDYLKHMFYQTIENGTDVDNSLKICCLIEKYPHLKSIHDRLKYLIERLHQLKYDLNYNCMELQPNNLWQNQNDFHEIQDSLKQLSIEHDQPPSFSMLQPCNPKLPCSLSQFDLDYYDHLEINSIANKQHTFDKTQSKKCLNLTIIDQDMDGAFAHWLRYLRLHKYQWFFNGLSYHEIESIDKENIQEFIIKVNKSTITNGAQNKICISTKTLRDRKQKLNDLLISLDLEVTSKELCEITTYMRDILHYPIPNKNCVASNQLQQDIVCIMEKLFNQLFEKLSVTNSLCPESLLGNSVNKFLECTMLITGNYYIFMNEQVYKTFNFAKKLKNKVYQMPNMHKNFFRHRFN